MSKQLFMTGATAFAHRGNNDANLAGTASWWIPLLLSESRGSGLTTSTVNTVTGPTNGLETGSSTTLKHEWISEPLSADFTISGSITLNLWGLENNMSANLGWNAVIDKIDGATGTLARIATSANSTEAGTTAAAANFTVTPTPTACRHGDRLRVRVFMKDAGGTMATAFSGTFDFAGATSGADGDSWVQFTENLTFEPAGDPAILVYQEQPDYTTTLGLNNGSYKDVAQPFVPTQTGIVSIRGYLSKAGSPTDNTIVEIQSDSSGSPSGTVLATLATIANSTLITSFTPPQLTWSVGISLSAGTTYWLVYRRTGAADPTNFPRPHAASGSVPPWSLAKNDQTGPWVGVAATLYIRLDYPNLPVSTYYLTDTARSGVASYSQSYNDQPSFTPGGLIFGTTLSGITSYAQSFVANGKLFRVKVNLAKNAAPTDNVIIEIQSDSAGSPSGTVIGTIATIAGSTLGTPADFVYTPNLALTASTTYWLVIRRTGANDGTNNYSAGGNTISAVGWGTLKNFTTVWNTVSNQSLGCQIITESSTSNGFTEKTAAQTRGSGSVNGITNTAAGPVTPIQVTATGGGTAIEWYTPPLNAISLGGKAKFNIRGLESSASANASLKAEIAICASDGTSAVPWGIADVEAITTYGSYGEINTSDTVYNAWIAGDDTSITAGQRLRFRIFVDDSGDTPLATGFTATVSYNGASAAAAGDTYVILPIAVTEQVTALPKSLFNNYLFVKAKTVNPGIISVGERIR